MTNKRKYTAPEIIGTFLCCDISEVDSYQPTLFPTVKVYQVGGDDFYCCPRQGQKPPVKDRDGFDREFKWGMAWTHEPSGRSVYCAKGA